MSNTSADAASPAPAAPLDFRGWLVFLLIFALCVGPTLVWPGDGLFFQDEPRLLAMAWHANHDHELATIGLYGNFAVPYGPLATQVYQGLELISHDPVVIAFLRALLCAGGTTAALLWLTRTLGFSPWYVVVVCLVPRMWEFQRLMWDASFAIPMGSLAVAALAANLRSRSRGKLLTAVGAALLVPLIHPQGLPLVGAIAVTLGWKCRAELWRHRMALGVLIAGLLVFNGVYIVRAVDALGRQIGNSVQGGYPKGPGHLMAALAPLCGASLLGDFGFTGGVTSTSPQGYLLRAEALWALKMIYPLCWAGILAIGWRLRRRVIWGVAEVLGGMVLLCLLLQAGLFGLMRIPNSPQYFFGTFAAHALLPMFALEVIAALRWRYLVVGTCALAGAFLVVGGMLSIHQHGFNPDTNWLTIADSKSLALELNAFSDRTAQTNVPLYQHFPQSLRTMRLLFPPTPDAHPRAASGGLTILSEFEESQKRARVRLVEGVPDQPGLEPMDITPLPKGWVPDPSTW